MQVFTQRIVFDIYSEFGFDLVFLLSFSFSLEKEKSTKILFFKALKEQSFI
jgi:hypothetical protein